MYDELGGDKLLQSFVEVGSGRRQAVRAAVLLRLALHVLPQGRLAEAGVDGADHARRVQRRRRDDRRRRTPTRSRTSPASTSAARTGATASRGSSPTAATSPRRTTASGSRPSSDPNTHQGPRAAAGRSSRRRARRPADAKDQSPWVYINDTDTILDDAGKATGKTSLAAATIMAPGWAHWSIGDLTKDDGKDVRDVERRHVRRLRPPGHRRQAAPVFAGGSNIAHLGDEQEPGPGQGADEDHLLRRVPADARRGRPRPGQQRLRRPRSATTSSPRRSSTSAVELQAHPGRARLGRGRVGPGPRGVLRQGRRRRATSRRSPRSTTTKITPMLNRQLSRCPPRPVPGRRPGRRGHRAPPPAATKDPHDLADHRPQSTGDDRRADRSRAPSAGPSAPAPARRPPACPTCSSSRRSSSCSSRPRLPGRRGSSSPACRSTASRQQFGQPPAFVGLDNYARPRQRPDALGGRRPLARLLRGHRVRHGRHRRAARLLMQRARHAAPGSSSRSRCCSPGRCPSSPR